VNAKTPARRDIRSKINLAEGGKEGLTAVGAAQDLHSAWRRGIMPFSFVRNVRSVIMPEDSSFANLLARLRAGDQGAATLVVDQYARRLVALARNHLDRRILRKEDPEDVLQSVFQSFFRRFAEGQFQLDSRDDLWALLVTLTLRKCGHRAAYYGALRRNVRRDVSPPPDASGSWWESFAREPTPVETTLLAETVERLLDGLEADQQQIVMLSLDGKPVAEVAEQLGMTRRRVQRVLQGVRQRLERWHAEAEKV
jgi:RNA polymerase sigma-70 factor (ECF subfamily)